MNEVDYNELWQIVLSEMEFSVSKANYATWFKNTAIKDFKEGVIMVGVPNSFVKEWLEKKFHKTILKILRSYCENIRNVDYSIAPIANLAVHTNVLREKDDIPQGLQLKLKEFQIDKRTNLNLNYTFKSFIVGSFNELAHAAALNVVEKPGTLYNPLYIYGGTGLGKTHLLQAIGNELKNRYPELKITYIPSSVFLNEYVENVRAGTIHFFSKKYKVFDVLIIDDIQFLGGKDSTQEELFHIFNAFQSASKQVVFSSDCPPKLILDIEDRLRSRFEGGMMADISKPDFESRMAILKLKTLSLPFNITNKTLECIALHVTDNIRELEGNLNLILAEMKLKRDLNDYQIKEILSKNKKYTKILTPIQIIKKVAVFYAVNERDLFEKTRKKEIVKARQVAMYILREDYNNSYPDIGRRFGGKDHTTAMHSYEKISKELKINQALNEEINVLRKIFYE